MTQPPPKSYNSRHFTEVAYAVGSVGLLGAMVIDATAVIGRHTHRPLLGSIELSEACIVLMAAAALVAATLERGHASVHLVTERLPPSARRIALRVASLCGALLFALITAGAATVASDLWSGAEHSELLHIPIGPLRVLFCVSTALIALTFFVQAWTTKP
jgi:TRAP-type C4-dicarboxylate transport system permease small subunit